MPCGEALGFKFCGQCTTALPTATTGPEPSKSPITVREADFDTFNMLWQRFAAEGALSGDEYVGITFPQYYRTVEEFTQPLTDWASPVYLAGLRLEQWETRVVPCPLPPSSASTTTPRASLTNTSRPALLD